MASRKKQDILEKFKNKITLDTDILFTDYLGLNVSEISQLRLLLSSAGSEFYVIKNTLAKILFKDIGLPDFGQTLKGPTALVFVNNGNNSIDVIKKFFKFAETHENLKIKSGYLSGKVYEIDQLKMIKTLPSREFLLSQTMFTIKFPLIKMINILNSQIISVVNILKNKIDKGG